MGCERLTIRSMKVRIDPRLCVGHGRCYALGPDVFGEDDRGHSVVELAEVPPEFEHQARAGEVNCPERAIQVIEDED